MPNALTCICGWPTSACNSPTPPSQTSGALSRCADELWMARLDDASTLAVTPSPPDFLRWDGGAVEGVTAAPRRPVQSPPPPRPWRVPHLQSSTSRLQMSPTGGASAITTSPEVLQHDSAVSHARSREMLGRLPIVPAAAGQIRESLPRGYRGRAERTAPFAGGHSFR